MPHAAFYVVQPYWRLRYFYMWRFQCRTQHFMWCNNDERDSRGSSGSFNAARSILCGATGMEVSRRRTTCFNAARSILCGATMKKNFTLQSALCFNAARSILCGATVLNPNYGGNLVVSMPHAAFYVVQQWFNVLEIPGVEFQCRTQHFMWCNS